MLNNEVTQNLLDFVEAAIELANNVKADIAMNNGYTSDETVRALNDLKRKHDILASTLDLANGVN